MQQHGPLSAACTQVRGELLQGERPLDVVQGTWLSHIEWERGMPCLRGQKQVWSAASSPAQDVRPAQKPLPSDSRFREDLKALKASPPPCFCIVVQASPPPLLL